MDRQTLYSTVANVRAFENKDYLFKNSNETRRNWRALAAPVVAYSGKKVHFLCRLKSALIYTWIAKLFILPLQICAICLFSAWAHVKTFVFLCKLKSVLIYTWIAKPFILPLQMFALSKIKITSLKSSNGTRRIWATLAAPVVAYSEK